MSCFMIVATACRVDKRSLSVFSFERDSWPSVARSLMSRAGVKGNKKLILVLIQERTLLLVSGRIESSALSLSLVSCSFSLAFSLSLVSCSFSLAFSLSLSLAVPFLSRFLPCSPSCRLSLSPSGSCLPSFLPPLSCNTFVGQRTQNKSDPFSLYRAYLYVREIL